MRPSRISRQFIALSLALVAPLAADSVAAATAHGQAAAPGNAVAGRAHARIAAGIISTVVGGVGGPARATSVAISDPCGVTYGPGHVYLSDGPVRAVSARSGELSTPAGDSLTTLGTIGPLGDRGPAVRANVRSCATPAVDHAGNLVIADFLRVRVVAARTGTLYGQKMTAGHIYTVAGNGHGGMSGNGGPATEAELFSPNGVAVDRAGNLVLSDGGSNSPLPVPGLLQVVAARTGRLYGQKMTAGHIYIVAGGGLRVSGDGGPAVGAGLGVNTGQVELDRFGDLVLADGSGNSIRVVAERSATLYGRKMTAGDIYTVAGDGTGGYSGDGGPATKAELFSPGGVTVDGSGNLVIADTGNSRVRVVAAASGTFYGRAMTAGDIYTIAGGGTGGLGDGEPAASARLQQPGGVTLDGAGNVVVADSRQFRVRVVAVRSGTFYRRKMTAGDIYTIAGNGTFRFSGDGGPATRAELYGPGGVTVAGGGSLLVADTLNLRVRFVAARSGTFYGRKMTAGDIYTVAGNGRVGPSGDGGPATKAGLTVPSEAVTDHAGNLVIADSGDERVRVVAATSGTFYGQHMTAGDIYTVAGTSFGFSGDGGPATEAKLNDPQAVAVDGAGNLVVADFGNFRVRVIAATSGTFYGVAMTAGDIYTVAGSGSGLFSGDGGPATKATLDALGVALDHAGNLVIGDSHDNRVRVVAATSGTFYGVAMTEGDIYTVAGNGQDRFSGDAGPATEASINVPKGVSVDTAGNLLVADNGNRRVRVVAATSGTFYGVAMTAGDIYTVAGDGKPGFGGDDGRPATKARVWSPELAVADGANLLVADSLTERVRMVLG